jgi:hypothetical protein
MLGDGVGCEAVAGALGAAPELCAAAGSRNTASNTLNNAILVRFVSIILISPFQSVSGGWLQLIAATKRNTACGQ